MLVAIAVFVFTLTLVIWQPKGLGVGWSAALGAVIALATGAVSLHDIPAVWGIVWNATFTFIAVIIISLLLDEAGFFEWAALHVARWANGSGYRLFAFCVLLGAAVSALFANDGAALILTPIVMSMLLALRFSPAATLAFVMAAGFIADTASLPLVVSNLVNIVSADYFGLGFAEYASVMVPVNLASVAATLVVLSLYFRRDIPQHYTVAALKTPGEAIHDRATFTVGGWVLLALLVGLFALEPLGIPISAVAAVCAALLFAVAARGQRIATRRVLREAPWQVVIFSLGMYLVVYGLKNAGLTDMLTQLLDRLAQQGLCHPGHRVDRSVAVFGHEQHAQRAGRRVVDPGERSARPGARGDDLRQCDWLRPGPENHPYRQPGNTALAACAGAQRRAYNLGLLLQGRHFADPARAVDHPFGFGTAP